jgi:nitronate monooxygenase
MKVVELESEGAGLDKILQVVGGAYTREMLRSGNPDAGVIACSQSIGLLHEIKPLRQVFEDVMAEASGILRRLAE